MSLSSLAKKRILLAGKLILLGLIVWYLIDSGRLDLRQVSALWQHPVVLFYLFLLHLVFGLGLNSLRLKFLLLAIDIKMRLGALLKLGLVSQMFGLVLPGLISVDGLKIYFIIKENPSKGKALIFWSVFMDRFLGALSILMFAAIGSFGRDLPTALGMAAFWTAILTLAITLGFILVFYTHLRWLDQLVSWAEGHVSLLGKFRVQAFLEKMRGNRFQLGLGLLLSLATQVTYVWILIEVGKLVLNPQPQFMEHLYILPFGELFGFLPLAPAGAGVGHAAYSFLYELVGTHGGADLYNLFFLTYCLASLLGLFPYLFNRSDIKQALDENTEPAGPA
ncbi:MAG: hypothetical protein A2527_01710 [Candidatus Lambdaproteobacteria bacterium RIFOXYD2_FULL_50_16]|uniref:TIGR00374 family protein n=1 Tax=Candidatus Lambdaproteobacteria bacterium RIFOXYD2_FULL_50_16 TaxID=1817772 RepID=A0A1F6G5W4_9PROT|nr:MAG: hypothetical protein A2527_01710 [Candidatus Lambdaproteobacteria bacterium RIFOXYD2_FULL_50_16]